MVKIEVILIQGAIVNSSCIKILRFANSTGLRRVKEPFQLPFNLSPRAPAASVLLRRWSRSGTFQHRKQVLPVRAVAQALGASCQRAGVDEACPVGDLFRTGDLEALPLLENAHELACLHQAL